MEKLNGIVLKGPEDENDRKDFFEIQDGVAKEIELKTKFDIKNTGEFLSRVVSRAGEYSEIIPLNQDGDINLEAVSNNSGRNILERASTVDLNRDGLNKLIEAVKSNYKNLIISLEESKDKLVLKVENKVKKGKFAKWVSQGVEQWLEPKRIVHLSEEGDYAFFDGTMTGIPVSQLEIED
jgi:hypothetical protein